MASGPSTYLGSYQYSSVGHGPLLPRGRLFFDVVEDGVGLFDLLLRLGFDHTPQAKAQAIQHGGHRRGRGQLVLLTVLGAQRLQGGFGRQARIGQRGAKRRVLLSMGLGQLTKGLCRLWMLGFPAFAATAGGLGAETYDT